MAVPVKLILMAAKFLASKEGQKLLSEAKGKATKGKSKVNSKSGNTDNKNSKVNKTDSTLENQSQAEKLDKIRETMIGGFKDYAVRSLTSGVANAVDAAGDASVNNANRLAAAIMAANRTNSSRQNDIYGPSAKEKASEVWAQEKLRRGENGKTAANAVANTIRDVAGVYQQREDAARAMQAQEIVGAPGSFYDYLNSVQRANAATTYGRSKANKLKEDYTNKRRKK